MVGVTEAAAVAAGHRCWCNTLPMSLVPRAGAVRDTRGIIKMTADADSNEVLGVAMVGLNAGEVIHEAAMAMRYRAKIEDFIDLLHVWRGGAGVGRGELRSRLGHHRLPPSPRPGAGPLI